MTEQLSLFFDAPPPPPVPSLPDHAARERIRTDLDANLLVEAGAGAGKTTEMVRRMVALVRSGRAEAAQIAAVTFTRKAAAELRERFQTELERALRDGVDRGERDVVARIDRALREIDRAFLGTIHAFCARLLRERPLDAGIDPAFRETLGSEEKRLRRRFWASWLERLSAAGDPVLAELRAVGLQPQQLGSLYEELVEQPDVVYPLERVARPEATFMRRRLEQLMDDAIAYLPAHEPAKGWDALQKTLHRLRFHRDVLGWSRDTTFLDVISDLKLGSFDVVQNRWGDGRAAKALSGELRALFNEGGAADRLRREWWAYRYPIALQFAQRAARAYEQERVRAGTLNFQDLLMLAAHLLRRSPAARRELGERYRYLLVDEFQDTDPIQAEVLFLLASDEELDLFTDTPNMEHVGEWLPPFASWRHLTPRPGALFVVGDPKQSIYRFRRADMTLYQQVKRRFAEFGAVVELIANFRSRKPIEVFVNEIFRERFPPEDTEEQAQFAAMVVQPPRTTAAAEGVLWYELDDPVNGLVEKLAAQDAERLASWVKQRIYAGERCAGDFLILTPNTTRLELYASQLESHDVPVQVTGAGVGEREELQELRLLLRALSDPGDATLTVAVLVGLFFGIDYEQLTTHAVDRSGRFRFTDELTAPATEVEKALATMHQFWRWTRAEPADVAVARIVAELGLVPLAAASPLGASRAGALLFAMDAIRVAALAGDASIAGAISALDAALDEDESEAPLEPGRDDVVRVMNLHKAKGLEARVVVLASPFGGGFHQPTRRVVRDETGRALGYTTVSDGERKLAQPRDWTTEHAPIEERFETAEQDRLLYVAATRAAHELVIGCAYNSKSPSKWRLFHNWLKAHATLLMLPPEQPARRDRLELAPAEIMTAIDDADARRRDAKARTYNLAPVTKRKGEVRLDDVEAEAIARAATDDIVGRGTDWGIAVHDALLAAARGLRGDRLRAFCRTRLLGLGRGVDAEDEPVELTELLQIVDSVLGSTIWKRAQAGSLMLVEAPFALRLTAEEYAAAVGRTEPESAAAEVIDGRIDLVFREADGWVIIDYKSDAGGERIPAELLRLYRGQLALYAAAWEQLTGERVKERALLFTATGAVV